jgi:hypothetical protein
MKSGGTIMGRSNKFLVFILFASLLVNPFASADLNDAQSENHNSENPSNLAFATATSYSGASQPFATTVSIPIEVPSEQISGSPVPGVIEVTSFEGTNFKGNNNEVISAYIEEMIDHQPQRNQSDSDLERFVKKLGPDFSKNVTTPKIFNSRFKKALEKNWLPLLVKYKLGLNGVFTACALIVTPHSTDIVAGSHWGQAFVAAIVIGSAAAGYLKYAMPILNWMNKGTIAKTLNSEGTVKNVADTGEFLLKFAGMEVSFLALIQETYKLLGVLAPNPFTYYFQNFAKLATGTTSTQGVGEFASSLVFSNALNSLSSRSLALSKDEIIRQHAIISNLLFLGLTLVSNFSVFAGINEISHPRVAYMTLAALGATGISVAVKAKLDIRKRRKQGPILGVSLDKNPATQQFEDIYLVDEEPVPLDGHINPLNTRMGTPLDISGQRAIYCAAVLKKKFSFDQVRDLHQKMYPQN